MCVVCVCVCVCIYIHKYIHTYTVLKEVLCLMNNTWNQDDLV